MEEDRCVCVSDSHEHGDQPCKGEVMFGIKVQNSSKIAGVCRVCYEKPFIELPWSLWRDE